MLFLIEASWQSISGPDSLSPSGASAWRQRLAQALEQAGGRLREFQVGTDLQRAYAAVEFRDEASLRELLARHQIPFDDLAPVRLVGAAPDDGEARPEQADYLVEWDFPPGLTMEEYLARKRANAPNYARVPEVKFLRTYVREDMRKCLCLYQAPDVDAVCRAREAVQAPITRLTRLTRE